MGPLRIASLRRLGALGAAVLALGGCSRQDRATMPEACTGDPAALMAALRQAPEAVTLEDGTPLSRCISRARTHADLQSLGISFGRVADALRERAQSDPDAALQLGYLAGAVRVGARGAPGNLADQLARRIEQRTALEPGAPAASAAAVARGLRAGEQHG